MNSGRLIEVKDFETMTVSRVETPDVDLSVVIPTFNESHGISQIIRSLHSSLKDALKLLLLIISVYAWNHLVE